MRVVPNVEALSKAIQMAVEGGHTDAEAYDALPEAPLPADVAAAVQQVNSVLASMQELWDRRDRRMRWAEYQFVDVDIKAITTILHALAAATWREQQLREALERLARSEPIMPTIGQYMCRFCFGEGDLGNVGHRSSCVWVGAQVLLAATPQAGLTVVDAQEYERLRSVEALWERVANAADKAYRAEATDGR